VSLLFSFIDRAVARADIPTTTRSHFEVRGQALTSTNMAVYTVYVYLYWESTKQSPQKSVKYDTVQMLFRY
jgi:hypothetical protein